MIRKILKKCYLFLHYIGHKSIKFNPLIPKYINEKKVKNGYIWIEDLKDPSFSENFVLDLEKAGIEIQNYRINVRDYYEYLNNADYSKDYYGGGTDAKSNFPEKTLEHYVSADLLNFSSEDIFIDIASSDSPFYKIVQKIWAPQKSYKQDLNFKEGIHNDTIGGDACSLPLPDNSISKAALHCSFEHFEGDSDVGLIKEMSRVLKPNGKLCILPFYVASEYTIHTDPIYNLFFGKGLVFNTDAQIRYCLCKNRHARYYNIKHIKTRILRNLGKLKFKMIKVENSKEVHSSCYLRFVAIFEKHQ